MSTSKPNILFIYSDQHRRDCVGVNGHPLLRTPALDRLAAEGANFTHAFTPIALCVPARCALLSGQWPTQHGVIWNFDGENFKRLDPGVTTSSGVLRDAGYHTIHIGRWHVDQHRKPTDFGFHEYVPDWRYRQWRAAQGIPPVPRDQGWRGQTDPHVTPEQSALGWGAAQVIDWIERIQSYDEPFFLRWHMIQPHLACHPCEPFASMYDPAAIDPWPGFPDELGGKPYIQRQMRATWGLQDAGWDDFAPVVARYLAEISQIDNQVGRVLDALDRLGISDNTWVIYTSDHGDMCGSHGMIDKHYNMYDDIVRVPLIMRWPGTIPAGRTADDFVSNVIDLVPSFCEAAGTPPAATFAGTSLLPAACGRGSNGRPDIFATYHGNQFGAYSERMVRDRRWKYVWNATDVDELYDLEADPGELQNRIHDPDCRGEVSRLRRRLAAWMEATDDPLFNRLLSRQILEERII
mgnify:CR=1 FL=1